MLLEPLKPGETKQRPTALKTAMDAQGQGVPTSMIPVIKAWCFVGDMYEGKGGDSAFADNRVKKSLNEAVAMGLSNLSLLLKPGESMDAYWQRVNKDYFKPMQSFVDVIRAVDTTPAYLSAPLIMIEGGTLIDPFGKATQWKGIIDKIKDLLATLLPAPKVADVPKEDPKPAAIVETIPAPVAPAPAAIAPDSGSRQNILVRIVNAIKKALGLVEIRNQDIKRTKGRVTGNPEKSRAETQQLLNVFRAAREKARAIPH